MKFENTVLSPVKAYAYSDYRDLVSKLSEEGRTTGAEQTPERIEATKLNAHRMKRIEKQVQIREDLTDLLKKVDRKWTWTVLVEAWCGDGAQNIPVIAKMASLNPNINLQIILRDENPEIMNQHLTNGSRSIPILICSDSISGSELGIWGPRPKQIALMALSYKSDNPGVSHDEFVKNLHLWYARDRGESIQKDFIPMIHFWEKASMSC